MELYRKLKRRLIARGFFEERKLKKIKENLFHLIFSCFRSHFYEEHYKKFSLIFLIFVYPKPLRDGHSSLYSTLTTL